MSSSKLSERYIDLEQICNEYDIRLFKPLSWILILNLELIPEEDIQADPKLKFSHALLEGNKEEALKIANELKGKDTTISKYFKYLLEIDPELKNTLELSKKFFDFSKRRIEFIKEHGIKAY
ncbi:MAG: hypothetical protein ACTSRR_10160 [Candidatus Heimdallarchaeaceae archaeon]